MEEKGSQDPDDFENSKSKMLRQYTVPEAIVLIIWNTIVHVNPIITGVTRSEYNRQPAYGNPDNIIENVCVTESTTAPKRSTDLWVDFGDVYSQVKRLCDSFGCAVRTIRPSSKDAGVMSFDDNGNPQVDYQHTVNKLRFDVYNGEDRSVNQGKLNPVIFDYNAGEVDGPSYLLSYKDYYNLLYFDSAKKLAIFVLLGGIFYGGTDGLGITGLGRKEFYKMFKKVNEDSTTPITFEEAQAHYNEAKRYLKSKKPEVYMDGQVAKNSQYVFKKDYFLGDFVTLRGDYGIRRTLQVSEYIRTEDENGESVGYPTLISKEDAVGDEEFTNNC